MARGEKTMGLETKYIDETKGGKGEKDKAKEEGMYLYCVADTGEKASLGAIGIAGNEVYSIPYNDICAVVHNCPAHPYQSDNQEVVKTWVIEHQNVVDTAWRKWATVLPSSFDTIIKGESRDNTEQNMKDWLKREHENLKSKLDKVRDKAEYGVQIFWDPKVMAQNLLETSPEIRELNEEIKQKPKGLAYMYRQKLENLIKHEMETGVDVCFRVFYNRIKKHTSDIRVEKTKKAEQGLQMILNFSCLVQKDKYAELGEELSQINQMEGFSVRFTGPWPPYSFVGGS
jgi:hypothetical protein